MMGFGLTLEDQRFKFMSKAKRLVINFKKLFVDDSLYIRTNNKSYKILGQIGMYDTVIDITKEDLKENDDLYFNVRPILIDSSIERKYI